MHGYTGPFATSYHHSLWWLRLMLAGKPSVPLTSQKARLNVNICGIEIIVLIWRALGVLFENQVEGWRQSQRVVTPSIICFHVLVKN